jgi:hypothetical protein
MTKSPKNNGRKSDGTFAVGNALGGKTKGARHKATMAVETLLDGQVDQLTQKAVAAALEGDMTAMRLCLERICPPRKDRPVLVDLPEMKGWNTRSRGRGGYHAGRSAWSFQYR